MQALESDAWIHVLGSRVSLGALICAVGIMRFLTRLGKVNALVQSGAWQARGGLSNC